MIRWRARIANVPHGHFRPFGFERGAQIGIDVFVQQILDIAHIIRRYPDLNTEWLFQQTERFHVSSLLFIGVRLASVLTGVNVPAAFAEQINKRRIVRMAAGRIRLASKPVSELKDYKESLASWIFKIRSRDGLATKAHLCRHMLRKIVAPRMVPERWRYHFFNRRIRKNTDTGNGI